MKKGKTIKYSVSVAVLASMMSAVPTFAAGPNPVTSTVIKGQISQTQSQIDSFETKMQQLDNQISDGMYKSQQLNDAIKAQQAKIEQTKADIEKAQNDFDAHKKVYSERLRSYQSQGQQPLITYAEILLASKDISEFLTRSTAISQFLQSDTDLLKDLNEKEQALKDAQQQLHIELDNLQKSQDELASEQQKIEAAKQEVANQLANSKNTLQQQQTQLAQQQAAELAAQRAQQLAEQQAQQQAQQLAQQQAQQKAQVQAKQSAQQTSSSSSNTAGSGSSSSSAVTSNVSSANKASQVIAYAEQFLGIPYVWGGSSPSGFDCSGLMQYSFRSVGVSLPRTAAMQQDVGTRISPSEVQPGDLVFKGDPAYHVGMYIGGGKWIQAPETGDVVKISAYNPSSFSSAARVLR